MYQQRPKKENNECQTDLQCTPFILGENETAKVHSARLCQTEIQLSPRTPDIELYNIIPYIDDEDIEKNAIRSVNITRNRKTKLHFVLPISKSNTVPPPESNEYKYVITSGLDNEVTYVKEDENLSCFSNEDFHKIETKRPTKQIDDADSTSSISTLRSAIKKQVKESCSTQTDLMIGPHILNDTEKAIISINTSCQTSVTCTPQTSVTDVVPMLRSYWQHKGETRETFSKSENVLEILKQVIQDVINIHQHMFDPNYNLPMMDPVLIEIGQRNSSADTSEWDSVSTPKKAVLDVSGDGSFENAIALQEYNDKPKVDEDFCNRSAITSISTISEVTTLRSSEFSLTSTKILDDDDVSNDSDYDDDVSDIIDRIKKKYPVCEETDKISNIKLTQSEPTISCRSTETIFAKLLPSIRQEKSIDHKINATPSEKSKLVIRFKSLEKSDSPISFKRSSPSSLTTDEQFIDEEDLTSNATKNTFTDKEKAPRKCKSVNSNCVCSGIKIKLCLKEKVDNETDNGNSERFIELKVKPNSETVEIKKLLNVSTDPELSEICTAIPFQEIENCIKEGTDYSADNYEDIAKLFDIEEQSEPTNADVTKTDDGLQIKINTPMNTVLAPKTSSEKFLQQFLLTNLVTEATENIESTPDPEVVDKVPFPNNLCPVKSKKTCPCKKEITEDQQTKQPVGDKLSPFSAVFGRFHEHPDDLIPFDKNETCCGCQHGEDESYLCDAKYERISCLKINDDNCSVTKRGSIKATDQDFDHNKEELKSMISYVVFPVHNKGQGNKSHNKHGIMRLPSRDNNSITYAGHVYQTDNFFPQDSDGSDGSDDGESPTPTSNEVNNERARSKLISYEEHMYRTQGSLVPQQSETGLSNMDCICALKLTETLRECPHCFRRIGPKYGLNQRTSYSNYDEAEMKDPTDHCSTKQSEQRSSLHLPRNMSSLNRLLTISSSLPLNQFTNTTTKPFNDYPIKNISSVSETSIISKMKTSKVRFDDLMKENSDKDIANKFDTANENVAVKTDTSEIISEYLGHSNEKSTTGKFDPSMTTDDSENLKTTKDTADTDKSLKNVEFIKKGVDKNIKNNPTTGKFDSSMATDDSENLKTTKNTADTDESLKNVEFIKKGVDKNIKNNPTSKCVICYRDGPCPKSLCVVQDVKHAIGDKSSLRERENSENTNCSKDCEQYNNIANEFDTHEKTVTFKQFSSTNENVAGKAGTSEINAEYSGSLNEKKSNGKFDASITRDDSENLKAKKDTADNSTKNVNFTGYTDTDESSRNVEFIEKVYPSGKVVIGKISNTRKVNNDENISKHNICSRDEPYQKSLCVIQDVKHPQNNQCSNREENYKKKENFETTCKTKCQTCAKAKQNEKSKNPSLVTLKRICSICSSKDELGEIIKNNLNNKKPNACTAMCKTAKSESVIRLEAKNPLENISKLTKEEKEEIQRNKCYAVRKKFLSCSNVMNKNLPTSCDLMQPNIQDKSPKTKCFTSKKSANTLQIIYPPKSESLNCACMKNNCRLSEDMEEKVCLIKKKSTLSSVKNKQEPVGAKCSKLLDEVKLRLENISDIKSFQTNNIDIFDCPETPNNSLESKYSASTLSQIVNETKKNACNSIQKSPKEKLSCSSTKTDQKDDYLSEKINSGFAKRDKENTANNTARNKQENMELEDMLDDEIEVKELLSSLSISTQPRVRILETPKYIYKSYSSTLNNQSENKVKEIFIPASADNLKDVNTKTNSTQNVEASKEEFQLANISASNKQIKFESKVSAISGKTIEDRSHKTKKIMNIHKIDGKYSVFSMEKKHGNGGSQTTVYILPNAMFSSLFSITPSHFLRERTESEIEDILKFSYVRKLHYERNPEFDRTTETTNSEEFINIIADQNLPSMNCAITCSCSSSSPKNKEQQTDKNIDNTRVDKSTSVTNLQENKNSITAIEANTVGIQRSYLLFQNTIPSSSAPFKHKNILNDKVLEAHQIESGSGPLKILGKYITWNDLVRPSFNNPIVPVQNTINSFEHYINYAHSKEDKGIQTSNISTASTWFEPSTSTSQPLTIEASTSTGNLEMESSVISLNRNNFTENFSAIDLPFQHSNMSDPSSFITKNITPKYIFQTPSVIKLLKQYNPPILTTEASTSTTTNPVMVQIEETSISSTNLIEEESTSPKKTLSSISIARISSPYKHAILETMPKSKSKVQTNFSTILEALPTKVEKAEETSTNEISPSTINISRVEELSLPKLSSLESFSLSEQISSLSLPKIGSRSSISNTSYAQFDTDYLKFNLNKEEWLNQQRKKRLHRSNKFIHKTSSSENSAHSNENITTSVAKHNLSMQNQAHLKSELINEIYKQFENKTIFKPEFESVISEPNNLADYSSKLYPSSNYSEEHHNLGNKTKMEFKTPPLDVNTSRDSQRYAENIPNEHINKEIEPENLLTRAIDAYTAYISLKKRISSNFNVSKINLSYQQIPENLRAENKDINKYSEYTKENVSVARDSSHKSGTSQKVSDLNIDPTNSRSFNNDLVHKSGYPNIRSDMDSTNYQNTLNSGAITSLSNFESKNKEDAAISPLSSILKRESFYQNNNSRINIYRELNSDNFHFNKKEIPPLNRNIYNSDAKISMSNFESKNKKDTEVSPVPFILKRESFYQNNNSKSNIYRDLKSDKFNFSNEEISQLNKNIYSSVAKINRSNVESKNKEDAAVSPIPSILKRESFYQNNNSRSNIHRDLNSVKFEMSPLNANIYNSDGKISMPNFESKNKEDTEVSPILSISKKDSFHQNKSSSSTIYKDFKSDKYHLKKEEISPLNENINKFDVKINMSHFESKNNEDTEVSPIPSILKKDSLYQNKSSSSTIYKDFTSDKFHFKTEEISPLKKNINKSDAKMNLSHFESKNKEDTEVSPKHSILKKDSFHQNKSSSSTISKDLRSDKFHLKKVTPLNKNIYNYSEKNVKTETEYSGVIYPKVIRNPNQSFKEDNYLRKHKREEAPLTSIKENDNYTPLGINDYKKKYDYAKSIKEDVPIKKTNSSSKNMKSNKFIFNTKDNYSSYLKREEDLSEQTFARKVTPPYLQSISKNISSKVLKPENYFMYQKKEDFISPKISTSKIASKLERNNSWDMESNKYTFYSESREIVSGSKKDILKNHYHVNNINTANSKNSATSKISSFVRNGTTSALLNNIGESPRQLSEEEIDNILPDIAVSSHRVIEVVQSCEKRLQPLKTALKDIKIKLKELNMPEVNGIIQNDSMVEENKTYIYLPPPPVPLVGKSCSYKTKMTFQLKKPMKPLRVTANVNPLSIKHKYILNDDDNNGILNPNYSSVSDPPYYEQRSSMNSINQPSHSQRYHPHTYIEQPHNIRKPVEVIEKDFPFSKDMDEYQYLPDAYQISYNYNQPRSDSMNNYVMFPSSMENIKISDSVEKSLNKTNHVYNNQRNKQNMKMFTEHYLARKTNQKK